MYGYKWTIGKDHLLSSLCVGMVSWLPGVSRPSPTRARKLRYGGVPSQTLSFQRVFGVRHRDCSGFLPGEREERKEEGRNEGGEGRREEGRWKEGEGRRGRRKRRGERNPSNIRALLTTQK